MKPQAGFVALMLCLLPGHAPSALAETVAAPRFVIQGDTVIDTRTHLVWQRCSVGQHWDGKGCAGEIRLVDWFEAQKLANGEWRLPTRGELQRLINRDREKNGRVPYIDVTAFPSMDANGDLFFWSGSKGITGCFGISFSAEILSAWFNFGFQSCSRPGHVRLVKGKRKQDAPWSD